MKNADVRDDKAKHGPLIGLAEAGAAIFQAEVGAIEGDDAAHFVQAGAHALADAVAEVYDPRLP